MDRVRREGPDPLLDWKVRLFFAGAAVLLLSIALDRRPLVLVAIAVLAAGLVLSVIDRNRRRDTRWSPEDEADEPGAP